MVYQFLTLPLYLLTRPLTAIEGYVFALSRLGPTQLVQTSVHEGVSPLYYLLLHTWTTIVGTSEIALRSLSLAWFIVAIVTSHHILQEVLGLEKNKSYLALLFFICNPFILYFAFQAQPVIMFVALSTLSLYFFLKKRYNLSVLSSFFTIYTHWIFIVVLMLAGLYALATQQKRIGRYVAYFLLELVLSVPLLYLVLKNIRAEAISQSISFFAIIFALNAVSVVGLYASNTSKSARSFSFFCIAGLLIIFGGIFIRKLPESKSTRLRSLKVLLHRDDFVYVKDPALYFSAVYYFNDKVYVYDPSLMTRKNSSTIIPKTRFVTTLPTYPQKAFIIDDNGYFEALAAF